MSRFQFTHAHTNARYLRISSSTHPDVPSCEEIAYSFCTSDGFGQGLTPRPVALELSDSCRGWSLRSYVVLLERQFPLRCFTLTLQCCRNGSVVNREE